MLSSINYFKVLYWCPIKILSELSEKGTNYSASTGQINELVCILEHRDANQGDAWCIYRHHHPSELLFRRGILVRWQAPLRTARQW